MTRSRASAKHPSGARRSLRASAAASQCWPCRGEPTVALAGARTAEAIVPAIEPDDRYPRRRLPGNCRRRGIEMSPKEWRDPGRAGARKESSESAPSKARLSPKAGRTRTRAEQARYLCSTTGVRWLARRPYDAWIWADPIVRRGCGQAVSRRAVGRLRARPLRHRPPADAIVRTAVLKDARAAGSTAATTAC